jgi:hypothetical protein
VNESAWQQHLESVAEENTRLRKRIEEVRRQLWKSRWQTKYWRNRAIGPQFQDTTPQTRRRDEAGRFVRR